MRHWLHWKSSSCSMSSTVGVNGSSKHCIFVTLSNDPAGTSSSAQYRGGSFLYLSSKSFSHKVLINKRLPFLHICPPNTIWFGPPPGLVLGVDPRNGETTTRFPKTKAFLF